MSPFDAARYARLLEGLEVTVMRLSEIRCDNEKLRLDSGYFAKPMLAADQEIRNFSAGYDELGALFSRFAKGIFDVNADCYVDEGVPFVRIQNLKDGLIDSRGMAFIPEAIHAAERKTELRKGDLVLSKTAYPAASLVNFSKGNTSQDTIATSFSEYGLGRYRAPAVVAYLNSKYGKALMERQFQGNVQLHLSLEDGRKVPIPRLSDELQAAVQSCFEKVDGLLNVATGSDGCAEQHLLDGLGLSNWQAPEPLTYVRSNLDALAAGRLDAEFFTPRVRALLERLGRDGLTLADVAPARHEAFKPEDAGETFRYIEIGDMRGDGSVGAMVLATRDAPSRATQIVRGGDVLTSTVRPIRRLSALINADQDGTVCSSGFVVLRPEGISGAALLTYLRLPLVCELMNLHTSASLYPAISERDLLGLPIPSIPELTQKVIEAQVLAARAARQRASQLLEAAKRAVEIAIEDSETAALAYLRAVTAAEQVSSEFLSPI